MFGSFAQPEPSFEKLPLSHFIMHQKNGDALSVAFSGVTYTSIKYETGIFILIGSLQFYFVLYADLEVLFMLEEKQKKELDKIIAIAKEKDNQINSMLFFNLIAAMPGGNRTEDAIGDMQNYLSSHGIEIVMDDVEMEEEEITTPMDDSVKPFNPSEIDIVMKSITLDSIVKRIKNGSSSECVE